jgi:hypothetical protein
MQEHSADVEAESKEPTQRNKVDCLPNLLDTAAFLPANMAYIRILVNILVETGCMVGQVWAYPSASY